MDKHNVRKDVVSGTRRNSLSMDMDKTKYDTPTLLSNSYGNIRSRYHLTETTGSCHDLCKYGKKHDSERGGKRLAFRRFIANSIASEDVHILVKDLNDVDGKKKTVIMTGASDTCEVAAQNIEPKKVEISHKSTEPVKEIQAQDVDDVADNSNIFLEPHSPSHKSTEPVKEIQAQAVDDVADNSNIFLEPYSPSHKSTEPVKEIQAQAMDDVNDQPQISPIVEGVNNTNVGLKALLLEDEKFESFPQVMHSEPIDEEINHVKFSNSCRNKEDVNKPKASVVSKLTPSKSSILKPKNSSDSTEADSNLKDSATRGTLKAFKLKNTVVCNPQSSTQNAFFSPKKTNGSAKTAVSLTVRSQMNASRSLNNPTNPGSSNYEISDVGEMKSLKSRRAAISSKALAHSAAVSLKARKSNYIKHSPLKKTVKVFEPKSEGKSLEHAFESAGSEVHEHSLSGTMQRKHPCSSSKESEKRQPRKPQVVPPANGSSSPYRLKFKRGKVIELRAAENVGARRLRFRRGRDLGENPSGEVMKRIFRRKRDIGDSNDFKSETHDFMLMKANTESKGVKLKHQSFQGKKKIQPLSNHVIEETANKLAEMRKSKVKALVGAFESVILLQESKPALV